MNLLMIFPWIQVSVECYDSIRILYMEKTFGACMAGLTYVMLAHNWEKGILGEGPYTRRA